MKGKKNHFLCCLYSWRQSSLCSVMSERHHCFAPHADNAVPLGSFTKLDQAILQTLKLNIVSEMYWAPQIEWCLFISRAENWLPPAKSEEGRCGWAWGQSLKPEKTGWGGGGGVNVDWGIFFLKNIGEVQENASTQTLWRFMLYL